MRNPNTFIDKDPLRRARPLHAVGGCRSFLSMGAVGGAQWAIRLLAARSGLVAGIGWRRRVYLPNEEDLPELAVRPAGLEDLDPLIEIQRRSPQASQWLPGHLSDMLQGRGPAKCLLAEEDRHVAGFLVYQQPAAGQVEILNLAVHPERRRRGIASVLLKHAPDAAELFLEVRASNGAALSFYQCMGFHVVGRRKAYYRQPDEDALVMRRGEAGLGIKKPQGN